MHDVSWGKEEPVKNHGAAFPRIPQLGVLGLKRKENYKNNPKVYECKGFLTLKLNFWVDKIHATLTVIQWKEIVKGVRFSILILGTLWQ